MSAELKEDAEKREYECEDCYVIFWEAPKNLDSPPRLCARCCKDRVRHDSLKLLKRRMSVIDNTRIHRFPDIIQHLFRHVLLKKEVE